MEAALKPVQDGRGRKRWWPLEQKLAVLQEWRNGAALRVEKTSTAIGCGGGGPGDAQIEPGLLWLSAPARAAQAQGAKVQRQDGVEGDALGWVALDVSENRENNGARAPRQGGGGRAQSAVGLGHHGDSSLGRTEEALGRDDRLCGPGGALLALWQADCGRGSLRDVAGGHLSEIRRGAAVGPRDRVAQRQRAGVHFRSLRAVGAGDGIDPLPHPAAQSAVKRSGGGVLWKLQARLRLSGMLGDPGGGQVPAARVDRALQPHGAAQRFGDAVPGRVLCGMDGQKQDTTCPKLSGAVQLKRIPTIAEVVVFVCGFLRYGNQTHLIRVEIGP